uniref:Uncharacterized protein n=1 Tax=Anguilla anguilla TaxID=7936 RepID=A0A0E9VPD4_ANGAN
MSVKKTDEYILIIHFSHNSLATSAAFILKKVYENSFSNLTFTLSLHLLHTT